MSIKSIIFDLDQTLVDTSRLEQYRRLKQWEVVLSCLDRTSIYPGIREIWQQCRAANIKLGIFTNSPRNVCEAVLQKFDLVPDGIVAFGETNFPKPSRDPAMKALDIMGASANQSVIIGDRCVDIISGRNAAVGRTIGAEWGSGEKRALLLSHPNYMAATVHEAQILITGLLDPIKYQGWLAEQEASTTARFNQELWAGSADDVERGHLRDGVFPYYFCRRRFKGPWFTTQANMLVKNLKFVGPATGAKYRSKRDSCAQMAAELRILSQKLNLPNASFAFIPGSKQKGHVEFDARFDIVSGLLSSAGILVSEPIITRVSHDAVHSDEDNYDDRDPAVIIQNLEWRGFGANVPSNVILIDDVITSGGHFRACSDMIHSHHREINIVGAFWAAHLSQ